MAIRKILRMGDPLLLQQSELVTTFNTIDLESLINDLRDTMHHANGAGLATPQIGVSLQVVIFGIHNNPRYPDVEEIKEQVLINPEITVLDDNKIDGWEGCLSIPGMRGLVPRYHAIRYSGYDEKGRYRVVEAEGFHARVVQHECDHLWGKLYPMRMTDMSKFGFIDEIQGISD
ncbi:MAG: peptide deformylase [Thiotrichaceae bacterium]